MSTVNSWSRYQFSLNSPYDPDKSSLTNTSAFGFYEWALLYREYQCLSSAIRVKWINAHDSDYYQCAVVPEPTNVYATSFEDLMYNRNARLATILSRNQGSGTSRSSKTYMTMYKLFGTKKSQMVDAFETCGTSTASPQKQGYWNLYVCDFSLDETRTTNARAQIHITYYVRFYNRLLDLANLTADPQDSAPDVTPPA